MTSTLLAARQLCELPEPSSVWHWPIGFFRVDLKPGPTLSAEVVTDKLFSDVLSVGDAIVLAVCHPHRLLLDLNGLYIAIPPY